MPRAIVIAVALGLFSPLGASAQIVCSPRQVGVGDGFNYLSPRINRDGSRVVFSSAANLTGQNADHSWEVFLFDVPSSTLTQITNSPTSNGNGNDLGTISGDGTRIAYRRAVAAPPFVFFDIWLYETATGTHTLISEPANPAHAHGPQISADGTKVVFEQANVGNRIYDVLTGTNSPAGLNGLNPSISGDGRYVAAEGFGGFPRFIDRTTNTVTQLPGVATINSRPSISADGSTIVFQATQNLTGQNADGSLETFLYNVATGAFTQISNAPSGYSQLAMLNANASIAVWEGNHNTNGTNPAGQYNVFAFQVVPGATTNISNAGGPLTSSVAVAGNGSQYAFVSSANLTGQNPLSRPQLFLACGGNRPPVADAGPDQVVNGTLDGTATVTFDGGGSSDADADPLTFSWTGAFGTAGGPAPSVTLGPGTHTVTLTVNDGVNTSTDWAQVTVNGCSSPTVTTRTKSGQVQLTWTAVTGAAGYNVYRSTTGGGPYTMIAALGSAALAYLDRPLTNGVTYYYVVRPTAADGDETCQSAQVSARPIGR